MQKFKICIVISILAFSIACKEQKKETVSIMAWNIWHGGIHGSKSEAFKEDTLNTDKVLKVLIQEEPDILFMQETYCCGMDIVRKAGYSYSCRGSSNLSIHSKYPIVDSLKIFKPFNSHAAIIDIRGQLVLCINVWLHDLPDFFQDIKKYSPDSLVSGEGTSRLNEITAIIHAVNSLDSYISVLLNITP